MEILATAAMVVSVVAAVRGTWSPCGVSMLSSITPLTESGRGNRYWKTAGWFVLGAVAGGATLGVVAAGGALLVRAIDLPAGAALAGAVLAAAVTLASDLSIGGWRLPSNPRQVNRAWLDGYRSWVYGLGFGWQLGVGVATFVMSATVYLMVVLAALSGRPLFAFLVVTGFGLIRGLAILPAAKVRTSAGLMNLHRSIERFRPTSRAVAVATQIAVIGVVLAEMTGGVFGVLVAGGLAVAAWAMRRSLRDPAPKVLASPAHPTA